MTKVAIVRWTSQGDFGALMIMQAMLNSGVDVVSVAAGPHGYHVFGVLTLGDSETETTLDASIEDVFDAVDKRIAVLTEKGRDR